MNVTSHHGLWHLAIQERGVDPHDDAVLQAVADDVHPRLIEEDE